MSITRSLAAPGDRLRTWWSGLSRVQKWGFGAITASKLIPGVTMNDGV